MTKSSDRGHLKSVAQSTLSVFAKIYQAAQSQAKQRISANPGQFASVNTLTAWKAIGTLKSILTEELENLQLLTREPAIARIVARDDNGKDIVYFISRAALPAVPGTGARLASYRSPIGRLASLPIGADFEFRSTAGTINLEVIERALLHPVLDKDWDSVNSNLQGKNYAPVTVKSFRSLIGAISRDADSSTLLERLLEEEKASTNIVEGIRRNLITKMGLRDQPILDQYQDEIFRLPLNSRLLILGPPGSGKTTTLIRRLGQKLDSNGLDESERARVKTADYDGSLPHNQSWLMFTPTELLKQYVKEAFAREGVAASDQRIRTWEEYRRELARNRLPILRTGVSGGLFVMRESIDAIQDRTMVDQIDWFEDFYAWQNSFFWEELTAAAQSLRTQVDRDVSALGSQLMGIVAGAASDSSAHVFVSLASMTDKLQELLSRKKAETDDKIGKSLNLQVNRDKSFIDELASFISSLSDVPDEVDDQDGDDEDEPRQFKIGREAAVTVFMTTVRAQARAEASKRALGLTSRSGKVAAWLGNRSLHKEERPAIGENLQVQTAIRRFLFALRTFLIGMPARYRRFRRQRQTDGRWYRSEVSAQTDVSPFEVDLMLLGMLRAGHELLIDRRIIQDIEDQKYSVLRQIRDLHRNQILVDEATDFSPIQLACMGSLCQTGIDSFFACGDFNQRVTEWGSRSVQQMKWIFPDLDIRTVEITYRHSRQLNDLARQLAAASDSASSVAKLPDNVNNEGVQPVLGKNLHDQSNIAKWLSMRIQEIERFTDTLPTIAVLVNSEADVEPTASALDEALSGQNIRAIACKDGRVVGQDNDIRVFDVQHIKGLEFEAVFFIGVDQLALVKPQLFDKFLYVGATRAATYLGLTCVGNHLPSKIAGLESSFIDSWQNKH